MENVNYFEPTIFDTLTQCRELQMLKTAIPYMHHAQKCQFALFIKFLELQHTMHVFVPGTASLAACEISDEENNTLHMLNEMRKFATPHEEEFIDNILNLFSMMSLYSDGM